MDSSDTTNANNKSKTGLSGDIDLAVGLSVTLERVLMFHNVSVLLNVLLSSLEDELLLLLGALRY